MSETGAAIPDDVQRFDQAWAAVRTGMTYVAWMSREFLYSGVAREDLEAEGRLGLFEAALRFDPTNGAQFLTYASWWARRRMQLFVAHHARIVRRPASRVGTSRERDEVSLDQPVGAGSPLRWEDVLADRGAPPLDAVVGEESIALVATIAAGLPAPWREIIVRRFGLDGEPPMTLAEIGGHLGLSRERVRQIEAKAMAHLRDRVEHAWGRSTEGARARAVRGASGARAAHRGDRPPLPQQCPPWLLPAGT